MSKQETKHMPTLRTIRMVEDTLKNADETILTFAQLKKKLPKQVNHNTLKEIIDYLDQSNKILIGIKGIMWIENNSPKLQKAIEEGYKIL